MVVKRTSVEAFVEIPRGSRNKYEYDKERKIFKLDRVLYSSVHYPSDYGFIPDTLSLDGDPLDVLVIMDNPTFPGCVIDARPIGVLNMADEQGQDEKILAVPTHDPRYRHIQKLADIGPHWLREIENFFATYKALEDKWTELVGWGDEVQAWQIIEEAEQRYRELQELKSRNKSANVAPNVVDPVFASPQNHTNSTDTSQDSSDEVTTELPAS
jgi:inorganic pyrophosphatase